MDHTRDKLRVGPIAQLEERLNGIEEVVGSIPIGSTTRCTVAVHYCNGENGTGFI